MAYMVEVDKPGSKWRVQFEEWRWKHLGGHIRIGRTTLFGFNAMHLALDVRLRRMFLCMHPTIWHVGYERRAKWPWYVYLSRNGTPQHAIWGIGPGLDQDDRQRMERRVHLLELLQG